MGIYDSQIYSLRVGKKTVEAKKKKAEKAMGKFTDPILRQPYQDLIEEYIDQIDSYDNLIERLQSWDEGSPNGYDQLSEEIDFSDPDNLQQIVNFTPTSNSN